MFILGEMIMKFQPLIEENKVITHFWSRIDAVQFHTDMMIFGIDKTFTKQLDILLFCILC